MNDVEKQILHDANDLFFIRVVSFDWTQRLGQNAIDSPWHIYTAIPSRGIWSLRLDKASAVSSGLACNGQIAQVHGR